MKAKKKTRNMVYRVSLCVYDRKTYLPKHDTKNVETNRALIEDEGDHRDDTNILHNALKHFYDHCTIFACVDWTRIG